MKFLRFLIVAVLCFSAPAAAYWQSRGSIYNVSSGSGTTYQGPGDVITTGWAFWGSCARVFTAALAATSTNMCDLVASTGGAAVCTLRGSSTGFADLSSSYCAGTTPSAACAAATGGSCKVSKVYNQVPSNTTGDAAQATLSSMAALTFAAVNGLPVLTGTSAANTFYDTATTISISVPFTYSAVVDRTTAAAAVAIGVTQAGGGNTNNLGWTASANTMEISGPGVLTTATANDNAWHGVNGLMGNSSNSVINVDGSDGTAAGTSGSISTQTIRLFRGITGSPPSLNGSIAEAGVVSGAVSRTNLYNNMHGSSGYNGAF